MAVRSAEAVGAAAFAAWNSSWAVLEGNNDPAAGTFELVRTAGRSDNFAIVEEDLLADIVAVRIVEVVVVDFEWVDSWAALLADSSVGMVAVV